MGCIITVGARIILLVVWISTPLVTRAFNGALLFPLLGIIFLPFTCLVYVLVYIPGIGVTGWSWAWVVLALLFDLGTNSTGVYSNRNRFARYRASGR